MSIEFQSSDDNTVMNIPQLTQGPVVQVSDDSYIQTQVSIMQSRSLLSHVLSRMSRGRTVDEHLRPRPLDRIKTLLGFPPSPPITAQDRELNDALDNLRIRANRQTRIVDLSFDSPDPRTAASFLDNLIAEYKSQNLETRWEAGQQTSDWLDQKLGELRAKLERSADELQNYAAKNGLVQSGGENNSISNEKLRQVQAELSRAQADRVLKQAQYDAALAIAPESLADVLDSAALRNTQARLTDLRAQLADLNSLLTPENYKIKRLKAQIDDLENSLESERATALERIRVERESAQRREAMLTAAYFKQGRLVNEDAAKAIRYDLLKREVDANRQLYDSMLQKVKEARVASAIRASNIRVVDPPVVPYRAYKPNAAFNLAMALCGGILLGIAGALVTEQFDRTLRAPGDAAGCLSIPELGLIPMGSADPAYLDAQRQRKSVGFNTSGITAGDADARANRIAPEIDFWRHGTSLLAESFRAVVASILLPNNSGLGPRAFVITSPRPREGKSTAVANLGIALARMNERVLIIDGDIRRSNMHAIFGVSKTPGFAEFLLAGEPDQGRGIASYIVPTHIPSLFLLPAGEYTPGVIDFFHSPQMLELFRFTRREFDYVLVDAPPVLQIPDARVLARFADSVILLLRAGETSRDLARLALQRLSEDRTPVLGTILNQWDPRRNDSSDYYRTYIDLYRSNPLV